MPLDKKSFPLIYQLPWSKKFSLNFIKIYSKFHYYLFILIKISRFATRSFLHIHSDVQVELRLIPTLVRVADWLAIKFSGPIISRQTFHRIMKSFNQHL